ncbi:hypothetical protein V8E52_011528 [Russula decolorans]
MWRALVPMMACAKEADNSICAAPKTLFRHTYPTGELIPQSAVARANGPPHPIHRKGGVQTQTRSATSVGRKLLVQDHSGSLIIMKLATSAVESTGCGDCINYSSTSVFFILFLNLSRNSKAITDLRKIATFSSFFESPTRTFPPHQHCTNRDVECLFSDVQAAAAAAAQFLDKHSRCAIAEVDSHHGLQLLGVALVRIAAVRNYLGGRQLACDVLTQLQGEAARDVLTKYSSPHITEVLFLVCVILIDCGLFELQYVMIMDHALSSPGTDPGQTNTVQLIVAVVSYVRTCMVPEGKRRWHTEVVMVALPNTTTCKAHPS